MKNVWILPLLLALACAFGCRHTFERGDRSGDDPFDQETAEMRKEVQRVRPQKESKNPVIYGGLSSEAQSIEDSLYGE